MSSKEENNESEKSLFLAHLMTKLPATKMAMLTVIAGIACYFPVSTADIAFSILFSAYLVLANILRFQRNAPALKNEKEINLFLLKEDNVLPWFTYYIMTFASAGILLPIATLILGPEDVKNAAAPHLFLLLSQINMEGVTNDVRYHNVIRLLVPIGFNAYRMSALVKWVNVARNTTATIAGFWYYWGLGLAVVNLVLWAYNLFVFLLLRATPAYFDPAVSPAAPVVWKGQVFPIIQQQEKNE